MKSKKKKWTKKQRERKRRRLANYFAKNEVAINFYIDQYGRARRKE